jgi:hypothetical protein
VGVGGGDGGGEVRRAGSQVRYHTSRVTLLPPGVEVGDLSYSLVGV